MTRTKRASFVLATSTAAGCGGDGGGSGDPAQPLGRFGVAVRRAAPGASVLSFCALELALVAAPGAGARVYWAGPRQRRDRARQPRRHGREPELHHRRPGPVRDGVTPLETSITQGPEGTVASASASFSFDASEPAGFECRLDTQPFSACATPTTYSGLVNGDALLPSARTRHRRQRGPHPRDALVARQRDRPSNQRDRPSNARHDQTGAQRPKAHSPSLRRRLERPRQQEQGEGRGRRSATRSQNPPPSASESCSATPDAKPTANAASPPARPKQERSATCRSQAASPTKAR